MIGNESISMARTMIGKILLNLSGSSLESVLQL